ALPALPLAQHFLVRLVDLFDVSVDRVRRPVELEAHPVAVFQHEAGGSVWAVAPRLAVQPEVFADGGIVVDLRLRIIIVLGISRRYGGDFGGVAAEEGQHRRDGDRESEPFYLHGILLSLRIAPMRRLP